MRLIDADTLIKAFNEAQVEFDEYYKGLGKAKIITDNIPTVDLEKTSFMKGYNYGCDDGKRFYERPKGEWNYFAEEMGGIRMTGECPNCKQRRIIDNFCSNCGADMRGEKDES